MEVHKIRQLVLAAIGGGVVLLLIAYAVNHRSSNPLQQTTYKDEISGISGTYYASKGLEPQVRGVVFVNSAALTKAVGDSKANDTLTALKQFVNTQSHLEAENPVIANVHKVGKDYGFMLFIDSNEQFYDVGLHFTNQQVPVLTFTADDRAKI